jgi:integrase
MATTITDKQLQNLKSGDDLPINTYDYPGLRVRKAPTGKSTTFYHRYVSPSNGKTVKATIGRYGKNPGQKKLKDAISDWHNNHSLLADKIDPRDHAKIEAAKKKKEGETVEKETAESSATVRNLIKDHIDDKTSGNKPLKGWKPRLSALERYLEPYLDLPAHQLERTDTVAMLKRIQQEGKDTMRNRVLRYGTAMYNWAIENDWPTGEVWRKKYGIPKGTKPLITITPFYRIKMLKEKPRERVPSVTELKTFLKNLHKSQLSEDQQDALLLIALTGCRGSEVCGMEWNEVHDDEWHIPGERVKNDHAHLVYLSPQAKRIINKHKGGTFVFSSDNTHDRHIRLDGVEKKLRLSFEDMKIKPFRLHDFRRALASWMGDNDISEEVHDRVLNHYRQSVRKTYNRGKYNKQAKKVWNDWGKHLAGLAADNVIQFKRRA